jgi:hypothetical protein
MKFSENDFINELLFHDKLNNKKTIKHWSVIVISNIYIHIKA